MANDTEHIAELRVLAASLANQGDQIERLYNQIRDISQALQRLATLDVEQRNTHGMITGIHIRIDKIIEAQKEFNHEVKHDMGELRRFEREVLTALPTLRLASTWVFGAAVSVAGLMTVVAGAIIAGHFAGSL